MARSLWPVISEPRLTARHFGQLVGRLASAMLQRMASGKPIAVLADQSVDGVLLVLAAIKLGVPVAFCSLRDSPYKTQTWLHEVGAQTLFLSLPKSLGLAQMAEYVVSEIVSEAKKSAVEFDHSHRFFSIIKTSGTSATPKSAVTSFTAHMASARSVCAYFGFTKDSTWGLNLPFSHVSGLSILFRALVSGGAIHVVQKSEVEQDLEQITHLSLVPSQLKEYLQSGLNLSRQQAIIVGGDALDEETRSLARRSRCQLYESYGLTETSSMIYVKPLDALGAVLPHARIKIAADGEIMVSGSSLFLGYLGEGGSREGYFATSDVGFLDTLNQLHIIGRKSNRVISGGENIQCEEVEAHIRACQQVLAVVVVGVPDERLSAKIVAFIKWSPGTASIDNAVANLKNFLKEHLGSFKVPKAFFIWPSDAPATLKPSRLWFTNRAKSLLSLPGRPTQEFCDHT